MIGQKDFTSNDQATSQSGLAVPIDVKFDSSGSMWVIDAHNYRVLEFKPPFATGMQASLVIGQPNFIATVSASAPPATDSGFIAPGRFAFDSSGNMWIADSGYNRVLEFKPPFSTGMSASLVIGQKDFTTGFPATAKDGFLRPGAVAFDHSGNLWVADTANHRVLEFKLPFSNGMNASLVIGQTGFETSKPSTTQDGLEVPVDLAIDAFNNLWVSDRSSNRLLEFKPPFSNGMDASLVIGQPGFGTKNPSLGKSGLNTPSSIEFDPAGNLWVSDALNNRLLEFQSPFSSGMGASLVIGQNDFTTGDSSTTANGLFGPEHVGFDSSGNLWVPEFGNNRVLEFTTTSVPEFPTASLAIIAVASLAVVALVLRRFPKRLVQY